MLIVAQGGWIGEHVPHIVGGWMVLVATVVYRVLEHRRLRRRPAPPDQGQTGRPTRIAAWLAASGLIGAAAIHAIVAPEHFAEALSYGLFFVLSALLQVAAAVLVVRAPTRPLLEVVVGGSLAILVLWAVTRTSGLPFGPEPGEAEPAGILDVLASACELVTAAAGAVALIRTSARCSAAARPSSPGPRGPVGDASATAGADA
jgi:hypothetical protein